MPGLPRTGPFESAAEAEGLMAYVDASPSPFHAVGRAVSMLQAAGFERVDESDPFPTAPGRYLLVRGGGSLVAWSTESDGPPAQGFRIVGAHTDSPNLRIKPQPDLAVVGVQQLGVEVYGGPLLASWLDRDLGLSGRATIRSADATAVDRVFHILDPVLRVAQLAIHLDRSANDALTLDRQRHLAPIWALGDQPGDFRGWLADRLGVERGDLLAWDAMTHDVQAARRIGAHAELLAAARLDNQGTCYAGTRAMVEAVQATSAGEAHRAGRTPYLPVLVLFDHEEVGSVSERGAASTLLPAVLERVVLARGGTREDYLRALAGTVVASGDMAHATHPNYAERHEPQHQIRLGGGPVLKVNAQLRYATDARGAAAFALACEQAGVPSQRFVNRTDLPCGSTVGPVTSSLLGATTVDVGAPMLSMHSSRELMAADDVWMYAAMLSAFLAPAGP